MAAVPSEGGTAYTLNERYLTAAIWSYGMFADDALYPPALGAGLPAFKTGRENSYLATLYGNDGPLVMAFRRQLETCFASLPSPDREALRPRLRSTDNDTFLSAQWELFTWCYLRERAAEVEHDPNVGGLTPDFRISWPSWGEALVEVWTDTGMQVFKDIDRNASEIVTQIGKRINTPYWLVVGWDADPPPLRKVDVSGLIADIRERLGEVVIGPEGSTTMSIEGHGVSMTLRAIRGSEGLARTERVGGQMKGTYGLGGIRPRRHDELCKKAKKYRETEGTPLVLVLCSAGRFHDDEEDLAQLCYGTQRCALPREGETEARPLPPEPDGLFTEVGIRGEPRRTHVSALMCCRGRHTVAGVEVTMRVLHNPFTAHPIGPDWFDGVPQMLPQGDQWVWKDEHAQPSVPGRS